MSSPAAVLSPQDQARVRYHLGYNAAFVASSLQVGIPRVQETMYLEELAQTLLPQESVPRVLNILNTLDSIECQMSAATTQLLIDATGTIKIRKDAIDALEHEYCRWAGRLADIFGAPVYPWALRFRDMMTGGGANNVSVKN